MSLLTNAANVQFATEYPIDKIVGIYRGSYNSATQTTTLGGYLYQYTIPHKFTRPVFCELLWSTDGVTYADGGSGTLSGTSGIAYSDANNIYVTTGLASGTIYYKVIASWIDNYDTTKPAITPILDTTQNFYFDSRNNYEKIYKQGSLALTGTSGTLSVIHELGYAPNAKVFFESFTGQVWPSISGGAEDFFLYDFATQYECATTITTSLVNMALQGGGSSVSARVWYRIYLNR